MLALGGMDTDGRPLNASARLELAAILASLSRRAMLAAPMVSGAVPNSFERTTRTRLPPMLTCTISRRV